MKNGQRVNPSVVDFLSLAITIGYGVWFSFALPYLNNLVPIHYSFNGITYGSANELAFLIPLTFLTASKSYYDFFCKEGRTYSLYLARFIIPSYTLFVTLGIIYHNYSLINLSSFVGTVFLFYFVLNSAYSRLYLKLGVE